MIKSGWSSLEDILQYSFQDASLLVQALSHPSLCKDQKQKKFEQLEFLGDRVLGLVIAQWLLELYPNESEGDLAKRFCDLVGRKALYHVARDFSLGKYLVFDPDFDQRRHEETIFSDGCEALIGAIFMDGGFDVARDLIRRLWFQMIQDQGLPPVEVKSALQEWLQKRGYSMPSYTVVNIKGPDHNPYFTIEVTLHDGSTFQGEGSSKREAEKSGAEKALEFLNQNG